ncbi:MAG: adenine nucleotide alpha hydrolase family protein [Desulfohalobiaceae bacterium]|nr:adenine nucleotide alpha hydrolase family protein [Desulfohalobiaceae bacterium]
MDKESKILSRGAKCIRCKKQAEVPLPSHHANFCFSCFEFFFRNQVSRGLKKMGVNPHAPLMIAVSGGKDSLALWKVLEDLGYRTRGIHLDLGLGKFSRSSLEAIEGFARDRGLKWSSYSLQQEFGYTLTEIDSILKSKTCALCGRIKRGLLNRLTIREGYRILVTGHHLDDEAGRLLGNLVGNRQEYVRTQTPFLPSPHPRVPARLKPLYRVDVSEIRAYNRITGIRPVQDGCPLSKGATSHYFKAAMDLLEKKMPGTKRNFLFSYLRKNKRNTSDDTFGSCLSCAEPAYGSLCALCSLKNRIREKSGQAGRLLPTG